MLAPRKLFAQLFRLLLVKLDILLIAAIVQPLSERQPVRHPCYEGELHHGDSPRIYQFSKPSHNAQDATNQSREGEGGVENVE